MEASPVRGGFAGTYVFHDGGSSASARPLQALNSFSQAACKPTNSFGLILFCFKIVVKIIKHIFKYFYLFIYYFLKIQKWILYFENRESTSDFQKPKMLTKPMLF